MPYNNLIHTSKIKMIVKELLEILKNVNPETKVLVRLDGSIFPTDNLDEHLDYNYDTTNSNGEYYILAVEEFDIDDDWLGTPDELAQEHSTRSLNVFYNDFIYTED